MIENDNQIEFAYYLRNNGGLYSLVRSSKCHFCKRTLTDVRKYVVEYEYTPYPMPKQSHVRYFHPWCAPQPARITDESRFYDRKVYQQTLYVGCLKEFVSEYKEAIWFTEAPEEGGGPPHVFSHKAELAIWEDCGEFLYRTQGVFAAMHGDNPTSQTFKATMSTAAHDFWLNRNHHGSGFWEKDRWPEREGAILSAVCHAFGEVYVTPSGRMSWEYQPSQETQARMEMTYRNHSDILV